MRIAVEVTDVGRVALGGTIGPEIGTVEGTLVGVENGEYVIAVSQVQYLRGGYQTWSGERVTIKKEYASRTYERRFHKGRSYALGAVIAGGILAVAVSQDLFGFGTTSERPIVPDSGDSFRGRRRP